MTQAFNTVDVLRLEVEVDPDGPKNLIQNPSGDLGAFGYYTPITGSTLSSFRLTFEESVLEYVTATGGNNYFQTNQFPVTPGDYLAASWTVLWADTGAGFSRASVSWLDASGARISLTSYTHYTHTTNTNIRQTCSIAPVVVPAGAVQGRLAIEIDSAVDTPVTVSGKHFDFNQMTVATSANSADLTTTRTNLCTNPSFETNTTGFTAMSGTTLARVTTDFVVGAASLRLTSAVSANDLGATYTLTGLTPGKIYTVSASGKTSSPYPFFYINVDTSTSGVPNASNWTRNSLTFVARTATEQIEFAFSHSGVTTAYLDGILIEQASTLGDYFDGSTAAAGGLTYTWNGTANASTSKATYSGLASLPPIQWLNIAPDSTSLQLDRDELNPGTLSGTVLSSSLDPSNADIIRPGRAVRLTVDPGTTGYAPPIFTGTLTNAKVTYNYLALDTNRQATITLTATDNVGVLANFAQPNSVGSISELPFLMEKAGVPWNVYLAGGNQVPTATVVATNDGSSLLDQVALTRDSNAPAYAWVDRNNILNCFPASQLSATPVEVYDETVYNTELDVDYDTDRCINSVTVTRQWIALDGSTQTTTYGPYIDAASVAKWGTHSTEITVAGKAESSIPAYAAAILAANSTPQRRVNSIVVPIDTTAKLTHAFRDLYDMITVSNTRAGLNQNMRVVGISHAIQPDKWLMTLSFVSDGTVASPSIQPATVSAPVSAWTSLTLATGSGTARWRVLNGVVYVQINIGSASIPSGAGTIIVAAGQLPAQCVPTVGVAAGARFGTQPGWVTVGTDGAISVAQSSGSTATGCIASLTWPVEG